MFINNTWYLIVVLKSNWPKSHGQLKLHDYIFLIICSFHICKCTWLLKFIYNPISTWGTFVIILGHSQTCAEQQKVGSPDVHGIPSWGLTRSQSVVLRQLSYLKQVSFSLFNAIFLCFFLVIFLFRMVPKHSAEVLFIF